MAWSSLPDDARVAFDIEEVPTPLFRDPVFDGAADPSLMWDPEQGEWWLFYTQRRANLPLPELAWAHGTAIGVATSADDGRSWLYRGTLDLAVEQGRNTFWAPDILHHNGQYHLFVSYITGVPQEWRGKRHIAHYTGAGLWDWTFQDFLSLSSDRVIDPDVHRLGDKTWRLWYKDVSDGSVIGAADSDDLQEWTPHATPVLADGSQEAPNVFEWQGDYWLVTDPHEGLGVYRSSEGHNWEARGKLLSHPGGRTDDDTIGRHPDIVVVNDHTYLFYFVNPPVAEANGDALTLQDGERLRRTAIQVAELDYEDGQLRCDRDEYA